MKRTVCVAVLGILLAAASALGTEFMVDTIRVLMPGIQESPAVATDGTDYLVVWVGDAQTIEGIRIAGTGQVVDGHPLALSSGDGAAPRVAFSGTDYLVVWGDGHDIIGRRVSPAGGVLGDEVTISNAADRQQYPKVAFDGVNYLVVWEDERTGMPEIYGARVSPAGQVLDPDGIAVAPSNPDVEMLPAIGSNGSGCLVAWEHRPGGDAWVYATRVSQAGQVLDPGGFPVTELNGFQTEPAVASNDTDYLVTWTDARGALDIYGSRVAASGQVLDSTGFAIAAEGHLQWLSATGFDGTDYLVTWTDFRVDPTYSSVYAARVSQSGSVLDPDGIPVDTNALFSQSQTVVGSSGQSFVVWADYAEDRPEPDIQARRIRPDGTFPDSVPVVVSVLYPTQWEPAASFDGTNYLVVWEEVPGAPDYTCSDVWAALVSPTGQTLPPGRIEVSAEGEDQHYVGAAFDGVNHLVVWQDQRDGDPQIYAARVNPAGQVLDADGIRVAAENDETRPCAAGGDTLSLVAWERDRDNVFGVRVGRSGAVLGDPEDLTPDRMGEEPAVAFDGTNFLVVYHDPTGSHENICGTQCSQSGAVLNAEFVISQGDTTDNAWPAVAFDGTNFLVAWQAEVDESHAIHAARLTPACAVLDSPGFLVSGSAGNGQHPAVGFDGSEFFVAWQDFRSDPDTAAIWGARVTQAGQVVEEFEVVGKAGYPWGPRLVRGAGRQQLLAYERWTTDYSGRAFDNDRVWAKLGPFGPGVEEEDEGGRMNAKAGFATIVRGMLFLRWSQSGDRPSCVGTDPVLRDITGRKVMDLRPGENDVRHLAPGVYFVRAVGHEPSAVGCRRVIVTR